MSVNTNKYGHFMHWDAGKVILYNTNQNHITEMLLKWQVAYTQHQASGSGVQAKTAHA